MKKNIILLASGSGSNAEKIVLHFKNNPIISIACVYCNRENAGVFERMDKLNIPCKYVTKEDFFTETFLTILKDKEPSLIILAGFLLKIPISWVTAFPNKIINLHPSLLPKYGGKGMYGKHVFKAILENNESESGITIHYVNENFDEGKIIFQAKTTLTENDTLDTLQLITQKLEHKYYPLIIEEILTQHDK